MLILDSLGSSFELEYKGDKYKVSYDFPTGESFSQYSYLKGGDVYSDLHKQFKALVTGIEGLKLQTKEKKGIFGKAEFIEIKTADELYKYPLFELQLLLVGELDKDLKKKYILTGSVST
jgi:hypothetical protein